MPVTLALMGLRGSGKSTIGPTVANRVGLPFKDLDPLALAWGGVKSVREVVDRDGWPAFRELERTALDRVLKGERCVLALGGGTPTHVSSRLLLEDAQQRRGLKLVYLRAQPETLMPRIGASGNRPSLTGGDPTNEIRRVFEDRDPLYSEIADEIIECDGLTISKQVDAVVDVAMK